MKLMLQNLIGVCTNL